jgi:hypothetical protein
MAWYTFRGRPYLASGQVDAIDVTPAPEGGRLLANGKVCLISRVRCTSQNASLKQYRKADALLRALLAKLDCDQMLGNEPDPERAYKAATLFFLAKAFKSYQAVHLLCSAGFFQDGAVLSRTIFEIFLQVSYMAGNPVERAPLFIKHDLVGRYFLYLKLKKYPDLVSDIEKRKENLEQLATQFKELEDQYHKGKGWWGNDLRWLAERVESDDNEAEKNYLRLYPLYSDLVHSTSSSVKHYIFTIAGRSTVDSAPSTCGEKLAAFPMATSSALLTGYYAAAAWEFAEVMAEALALAKELVNTE